MLEAVSAAGARTASVARPSAALHIDTADDVLEGNRLALRRIQPGYADARIVDSRISGDVAIHESALLESTVVLGPVLIGPSARLYDSYVGPYTAIGRGASLEFVEIENSVVLEGAVVERTGPRLRESILGVNARVFGGSQVQSVRLLVGRDAEISLP
jgi:glucose-1-phosphate thymidylyltransferase